MSRSGNRRTRTADNTGLIPILARKVREVEAAAQRGKVAPANRTKFLVVALLMREERASLKTDAGLADAERAEQLKRLDGIASILARTAARDTSLIALLETDAAGLSPAAKKLRREYLEDAGYDVPDEEPEVLVSANATVVPPELAERQVVPTSVKSRQLANPFMAPDLTPAKPHGVGRLSNWELLGPLYRAFEYGAGGRAASMELPEAPTIDRLSPPGRELMVHQSRFLQSVQAGHRTFLLADEPGLGKTAQSLLAASVADAYPLLAVVPNVVKMNWAREVEIWTPHRRATVVHGDGEKLDAFADVVIVNYEVLDRHLSWLGTMGFRGMVVDEAHFIKNMSSLRSRNVLALADRIRRTAPGGNPLMMALTGTPLINDVDDFRAIWQFLGWIDGAKPTPVLMERLEEVGLTPADAGFFSEAREAVIDMGIVRRRKIDVAADLPSKRIVDLPVELDDDLGRSIRDAERELGARLVTRYRRLIAARANSRGEDVDEIPDDDLMRLVARQELEDTKATEDGLNVFTMVRRIGTAKAGLAADYAAQLARSVGKVVFFAKHIDVMDAAEELFAKRELKTVSIRGDQSATLRQRSIDDFNNDPDVSVAVCSLTAAGVGLNLQAASNVVLAELSWTAAEQTQAIDRVHRIGQEEPVTAWRIIAAQTIDTRISELIDSKQGLAARALDGSDVAVGSSDSVQVDALVSLLRSALES
ncbi:DEAD/DEAH box helicase [Herbiconiux sp.]|uniref:DEAD/DEAH box helicase n=1 Tax=Herbiconiux sp. TaxID=1871186 RepID=UPI0025C3AD74|nr:DEAD/DEAH box helicase [Herbiconiux sp.]